MKIEHAALYVNDLEAAKDFFVRYLDAVPNEGYHPADGLPLLLSHFRGRRTPGAVS